jgi:hypothetical protein
MCSHCESTSKTLLAEGHSSLLCSACLRGRGQRLFHARPQSLPSARRGGTIPHKEVNHD